MPAVSQPKAVHDIDQAIRERMAKRADIVDLVPRLWAQMATLDAEVDDLLDLRTAESR